MGYEFTEEENKVFEDLNKWQRIFSFLVLILGMIGLVIFTIVFNDGELDFFILIISVVLIIIGILIYLPNDNFKAIIHTEGRDIEELVTAFLELNRGWGIFLIGMIVLLFNSFIELVNNL